MIKRCLDPQTPTCYVLWAIQQFQLGSLVFYIWHLKTEKCFFFITMDAGWLNGWMIKDGLAEHYFAPIQIQIVALQTLFWTQVFNALINVYKALCVPLYLIVSGDQFIWTCFVSAVFSSDRGGFGYSDPTHCNVTRRSLPIHCTQMPLLSFCLRKYAGVRCP